MEVRCKEKCPCCETCKECVGFQKILDLKNAGLVIYRHTNRIEEVNKTTGLLKSCSNTRDDIFIIHNTKDIQIKADDCISEIDQDISCARCRELVQRAKKYLRNVPPIDKKDIISICDHCQQNRIKKRTLNFCYKCHEALKKYHAEEIKQITVKEQIKKWLSDINNYGSVVADKKMKKPLKCRSRSELYLDKMCNTAVKTGRYLEVRPMLQKGVKMTESRHSIDKDTKSESALKFSDSEYIKSKSVLIRADSLLKIESYVSPSVTTYDMSLFEKSHNKYEEGLRPTTSQIIKGILQRDTESAHKIKTKGSKALSKLRKYYSEEDIFFSEAGPTDQDMEKNFSYVFPKGISDKVAPLRRVKTSAELISDTQEMLRQRAMDEKSKFQAPRKILPTKKIRSGEKRVIASGDEDNKKVKKKKSEESDKIKKVMSVEKVGTTKKEKPEEQSEKIKKVKSLEKDETTKKEKPEEKIKKGKSVEKDETTKKSKESKSDKEKVQKDQKEKKEPEPRIKEKSDQVRKEKEDKLRLLEEKKQEQERLKKEKEEKQREKQEQLRKEKEFKQKLKEEQQKMKEEKEKNKKIEKAQAEPKQKPELTTIKKQQTDESDKHKMEDDRKRKEEAKQKLKALEETNTEKKSDHEKPKVSKTQEEPTSKELHIKQIRMRMTSSDDLILQLVRLRQSLRNKDGARPKRLSELNISPSMVQQHNVHKNRKKINCAMCIDSDFELDVENIVNAKPTPDATDIIVGNKIFKCKHPLREKIQTEEMIPMLYKSLFNEDTAIAQDKERTEKNANLKEHKPSPVLNKYGEQELPKGVIRYALSDRSFIDKGWTMLPTEKVVRKMNVYRMRPAHPEFDWFERNKNKRLMLYDTGEKLAEFDDNGRGRWFYRNGRIALDYYDAEEMNAQQRFVIYGSGEPDERGRYQPISILGTFDYLGNGVVFDHTGKIRLKYNQTEGVVLDRNIGPVSHWKWHTLNDPPVLQQVMIDTQMAHKDPEIVKLGGPGDDKPRPDNEEMLAIEFDNFIKEKSKKLSQKFKPFQIKMKALKINENFSLKVLDQANIYLIFRDGTTNIKLNIGMILDHQEIVDTDTAEVGEVSNNLERFPARTDSLAGLQRSVAYAQRVERLRVERDRRLRHPEPCSSADKLMSAASRPLKPKLRAVASTSTVAKDDCICKCRKLSTCNVYYDTRFI